jgi:hypothetical protein
MTKDREQGTGSREQKRLTDEQLKELHDVAVERSKIGWAWKDVAKALEELIELRKAASIPQEETVD